MVRFLNLFLKPAERCGPLCRSVQDEVESMRRADAIEDNAKTSDG